MGRQKLWLDENRGWCKSTLPLCHSNPDPFSKRMLSRLFGLYARPPAVSIPSFLLFHPLIFPRILLESETKNTRLPPFFFLLEEEEEKKKQQQRSYRASNVGIVVRVSDPLFFSIKFHYSFEEMKKICQFFLPLFFFSPFPINFNSSFRKHLFYVIASNV